MTLRRAFVIVLFSQLVTLGAHPTPDLDAWWHLRTGELIWHAGIPDHDVFSFTARDHVWITHEWLSDALMWGCYRAGGLVGLVVAFALLPIGALWLVYRRSAGGPYVAGLIVAFAAATGFLSFGVRPQVFNVLFAAAFVSLLEGYKDRAVSRRALWLLPALTVLWANLHSGYLLGVGLLTLYAAAEAFDASYRPSGRTVARADVRLLIALAVACLVAGLLNPNGWRLLAFPLDTFASSAIQQHIAEWASPDFHSPIDWPFAAMLFLGVAAFAFGTTRPDSIDVILFVTSAAAGLLSRRHIAIFATVSVPALARAVMANLRGAGAPSIVFGEASVPTRKSPLLNWALVIVGLASVTAVNATRLAKIESAISAAYPVAAVDFLEQSSLAARRGYNEYMWGGYLIWRHVPVFVDGRAELYGNDFLSYYFQTLLITPEWRRPLDDYEVVYVLVTHDNPLATLLTASGEWREAYADRIARVLVRYEH